MAMTSLTLAMPATQSCKSQHTSITQMKCEYQQSPLGIDMEHPRFTWQYAGDTAWHQASYQLLLTDESQLSRHGKHIRPTEDVPVTVSAQTMAEYAGRTPLRPHTTYYWQIKATDADGKHVVFSPIATFETAKLSSADWKAKWISDGRERTEHVAPLLRKVFVARKGVQKARLYLSAAAYAKVEINGQRPVTTSLNPGYTHYNRRNLYNVYDVTPLLHEGQNVITAVLGNGFYNEIDRLGVWDFEKADWHGRPRLRCELRLTYPDGVETIATDETWRTTDSPCLVNDIYSGDTYDARKALPGIASPDYDDSHWARCVEVVAPSPRMQAQQMHPVEIDTIYRPKSVRSIGDSIYVIDFGTNMSGYARLRLKGRAGTVLRVQHGEELDAEGRLNVSRITGLFDKNKGFGFQTDVYTLSGNEDVLSPEFTYHGFRYIEVHASPATPITADNAEALFVHTAMRPIGRFSCSNDTLNLIWQAVNQSYLSNFMSIPTDCPQREKNGWTADAHISSDIGMLNYDSFTAYEKWLNDMEDNQRPDGQIADIIPSSGWGYGVNPVWSAAMYIIPMNLYYYTGDLKAIRQALPLCKKYLKFLQAHESEIGSIAQGLGDWVPFKTRTPEEFTSTCYYYLLNDYVARFCKLLGTDATPYEAKAEQIRKLLNTHFYNKETGLYSNGSQTAQATPLFLGIVPEEERQALAERLSRLIAENGNHLDFGMLGSKTVLRMLTAYGHIDQAVEMALQQEAPSWTAWIASGHTTPPEEWVPQGGTSLNHVFLGDINAWMYHCLAGINYDPEQPGFRHIIIEPHFPARLTWAEASYESVAGLIRSRWERREGAIRLEVEVPVNCTATIRAAGHEVRVGAGRHSFDW